jgi:TetR/AcrR family transcriptional regulator
MVHYYFKNREQLTEAVFMERVLMFRDLVWTKDANNEQASVAEILSFLVRRIIVATEQLPWLPNLWVKEVLNESGLLRERMMKNFPIEQFKRMGMAIAAGQQMKKVNPNINPTLTVVSVFGLTMMLLAGRKAWGRLPETQSVNAVQLAEHILALVLDGVLIRTRDGKNL